MELFYNLLTNAGGLLASALIRNWMGTLEYKAAFVDPHIDPASPHCSGQKIYLFWHEYILFPLAVRGHCNVAMLLSRHRDAEILSRVAYHLGFACVRGSTRRGGVAAIRQMLRRSRQMHLTITPDGPRGPRRRMALGPIYLASKLGIPLVATGYGYDRPWRASSWDRFAIPRPGSRARAVSGPEIYVPPDLDREGLERFRQQMEDLLDRLTREAEQWAQSGTRRPGQVRVIRQPARRRRFDPPQGLSRPWCTSHNARWTQTADVGLRARRPCELQAPFTQSGQ
ncbi:MAG TPA: DUF374 domain-containing protein [Planctomycetaceae bacterium]|nr:DUF374 domain-containing protein [Planctomycetaceae bacterium]HIQ19964.1 DUF374 domain-containing protein [Planctomycetota bacterium]